MTSYIEEFGKKKKSEAYYEKLVSDIDEANKEYRAFIRVNQNAAKAKGGFPFSVKSNICVKDFETTAGSKMLAGYLPPFNATVVERMLGKGFNFIGSTNMDEFGFGTFGTNCEIPARNAFGRDYAAGGSSSGAAVATALLKYHVAIAESTGGSIATPAALNGVVGFTPTYGAVSRYGLIDYANSLDKIGVIARSADDVRSAFDIIKGSDDYDTTCTISKISGSKRDKIVVVKEMLTGIDEKVRESFDILLNKIEGDGYSIEHVSSNTLAKSIEPYYIVAMAEASTNLAKYNGYKYGYQYPEINEPYNRFFTEARVNFGTEAKRRIILGTFIRSASVRDKYYTKALMIRESVIKEMKKILKDAFILSPTLPIQTPKIKEISKLTPVENYMMDAFTIPPNFGGFPHITFPYDYIDGMPLGAQLVTDHANDYSLLSFVDNWEKSFKYKFKHNLGDL